MLKQQKIIRFLQIGALLAFVFFVVLLFLPRTTHAEVFGSVVDTLSGNTKIQTLWKVLLTVVNSLVIVILIVVAFAEILRIDINTYGFKKILPTLVMAILAANFSYILCKLMVDLSNVALTFFSGRGELATAFGKAFPGSGKFGLTANFQWTAGSYTSALTELFAIIFNLVLAILILVLVFLFWVRTAMVYVLTIVSPVAFMSMALPQTKNFFTTWWKQALTWIFLPIPSVFFIWAGSTVLNALRDGTDSMALISMVIAGVCIYFAITTPFKLGGPVMAAVYKGTGAQFLAGKAKDYWGTRAKSVGMRAWNKFQQVGLDMKRQGSNKATRWIGSHWMGSGMAKAKADLAHEEDFAKGLEEGIQGRHELDRSDRTKGAYQMEKEYRKNRAGEVKEFESYALLAIQQKGVSDPNDPVFQQLLNWRIGSGMARSKMAAATSMENAMISEGQFRWLSGGGDRKDLESDDAYLSRKQAYFKSMRVDADIVVDPKTGKKILVTPDWEAFNALFWRARSDEEAAKAGMEKMSNDASIKPSLKQTQLHERELIFQMMNEIESATADLSENGRALVKYLQETGKTIEQLTEEERATYRVALADRKTTDEAKRIMAMSRRAQNILAYQNILRQGERLSPENFGRARELVDSNRADLIAEMQDAVKKDGAVPSYLQGMMQMSADGKKVEGFRLMERVVYTRKKGIAMAKTNSRAANDYAKRTPEEVVSIMYGSDFKDGLTEDLTERVRSGRVVTDANKESRIMANDAGGVRLLLRGSGTGRRTAEAVLSQAPRSDVERIARDWVRIEGSKDHKESSPIAKDLYKKIQDRISSGKPEDMEALRGLMMQYYDTYAQASTSSHLRDSIDQLLLPGEAT